MPDIDRFGRSERDYSRPSTPIQSGGSRGEFSDRLYTGRNPFIQPFGDDFSNVNTPRAGVPAKPMAMPSQADIGFDRAGQARRFGPPADIGFDRAGPSRFGPPADIGYDRAGAGIFGGDGSSAYAANDIFDAIMGGMNRSQQDAGYTEAGDYMQTAGGYGGYNPDPYDDEYGPFIPPSVIEMDMEGIGYDPADEYEFDRKRGWPGHVWDDPPEYVARGGLMSLRR